MWKLLTALVLGSFTWCSCLGQWTYSADTSTTWEQAIDRYSELAAAYRGASLMEIGKDDDGSPIHLFVLSDGSGFTPESIRKDNKRILWITNGIHAGEPDGIDASMMLAQALLDSDQLMGLLAHTAVCIVPVYNVSGARQRNSTSRVNQNGPQSYGFRANARNLDLNRDFIKADAENTRSLLKALVQWDPDVYFETHVSNGADHQYVMELLTTQRDKLDADLSAFVEQEMVPELNAWMERKGIAMCPYFETMGACPEDGLTGFVDGPRYSTGHAALCHRIGILSESHMLKPYAERVNATFQLLLATLSVMDRKGVELRNARNSAKRNTEVSPRTQLNWILDTTRTTLLDWKGYAPVQTISPVSGMLRTSYDRTRPTEIEVPWMHRAIPTVELQRPQAYLIPQAWTEVVDRLELEGVKLERIGSDSSMAVEVQYIEEYSTVAAPYEGHYLHHHITTRTVEEMVIAHPGDRLVPMGHNTDRLVMEILEPRGSDSFFAWGFFDSILQQKEWFSDHVFEDIAAELIKQDPSLQDMLDSRKALDPDFAEDGWAQLYAIYQRSPHFEVGFRRYPVLRVIK